MLSIGLNACRSPVYVFCVLSDWFCFVFEPWDTFLSQTTLFWKVLEVSKQQRATPRWIPWLTFAPSCSQLLCLHPLSASLDLLKTTTWVGPFLTSHLPWGGTELFASVCGMWFLLACLLVFALKVSSTYFHVTAFTKNLRVYCLNTHSPPGGWVPVDAEYRWSNSHVHAVGDLVFSRCRVSPRVCVRPTEASLNLRLRTPVSSVVLLLTATWFTWKNGTVRYFLMLGCFYYSVPTEKNSVIFFFLFS